MEIDVFPLLFSSKSKREFKEKRLERVGGGGGREEKTARKRGARSRPQSAGFLPAEPGPKALFRSRRGLGAFKGF